MHSTLTNDQFQLLVNLSQLFFFSLCFGVDLVFYGFVVFITSFRPHTSLHLLCTAMINRDRIVDVWADNLLEEIAVISEVLEDYPYVAVVRLHFVLGSRVGASCDVSSFGKRFALVF